MPHSSLSSLIGSALALALAASATPSLSAQEKPAPATNQPAGGGQYFELRIYTPAPGKLEALHKRFRENTLKLFGKHGIKSVGYWTAVDEKHQGRLYFMLAYPDKESRDRMFEGFAKDPEWMKVVAESQKDGKLVESVEQVFLSPTDYSPIR